MLPPRAPLYHNSNTKQLSGNFVYYRMDHISDIYFVGGFGTVQWVDTNQFRTAKTDPIVTRTATSSPEATLLELNGSYGRVLPRLLDAVAHAQKRKLKAAAEEAVFVSIDRLVRGRGMLCCVTRCAAPVLRLPALIKVAVTPRLKR